MAVSRTRSRGEREAVAEPKNDAYTGLLIISLLAMITGSTLLYLDFSQYGTAKAPNPPSAGAVRPAGGALAPPPVQTPPAPVKPPEVPPKPPGT